MGVVNSIPLCSRNKEVNQPEAVPVGAAAADPNNNQPMMPSLHREAVVQADPEVVVSVQPGRLPAVAAPTSMENPTARYRNNIGKSA